ncbi:MAG: hypothetical protein V4450_05165 [Bacteroidota bacterium]
MRQLNYLKKMLLIALAIETLCVTYALYLPSMISVVSVLHTLSGISIAIGLLWTQPSAAGLQNEPAISGPTLLKYRLPLAAIVVTAMFFLAARWMRDEPLNYREADMLPIIKIMCERFLAGAWSHVYDPIPQIWQGTGPIYLPAMWLPFTLPVALHIDPRWLTVGLLFVVFCVFLYKTDFRKRTVWIPCTCCILLFVWLFTDEKASLIPYTEEGVVVFYYVMLMLALLNGNVWLIGIAASLCVLSRYALIGWLPAMLLYYAYRKEWRNLFRFIITGTVSFFGLLILPFGWGIFSSLSKLPSSYVAFTSRVWQDAPAFFTESLGWAKFFGPTRINMQHQLLLILSFVIPVVAMCIFIWWQKRVNFAVQNIPLAVLKITLVVFYTLVDVPYLYLFYTSSFVSLFAVAVFLQREKITTTNV